MSSAILLDIEYLKPEVLQILILVGSHTFSPTVTSSVQVYPNMTAAYVAISVLVIIQVIITRYGIDLVLSVTG